MLLHSLRSFSSFHCSRDKIHKYLIVFVKVISLPFFAGFTLLCLHFSPPGFPSFLTYALPSLEHSTLSSQFILQVVFLEKSLTASCLGFSPDLPHGTDCVCKSLYFIFPTDSKLQEGRNWAYPLLFFTCTV